MISWFISWYETFIEEQDQELANLYKAWLSDLTFFTDFTSKWSDLNLEVLPVTLKTDFKISKSFPFEKDLNVKHIVVKTYNTFNIEKQFVDEIIIVQSFDEFFPYGRFFQTVAPIYNRFWLNITNTIFLKILKYVLQCVRVQNVKNSCRSA